MIKNSSFLFCEFYAIVGDNDETAFVEVTDGLLINTFGNAKLGFDIFGTALVTEVAAAALRLEITQQGIGEICHHATGIFWLTPFLDFRGCHDAIGLFVNETIDEVSLSYLHALLLLTEGTEKLLHQAPIEEGAIFIDINAFEGGKFAYHHLRGLGSSNETFFVVEIEEYVYLVTYFKEGGHIAFWKKDFFLISFCLEVHSEIYLPCRLQAIKTKITFIV